jgi:lipopolysaccharide transport system permease protein
MSQSASQNFHYWEQRDLLWQFARRQVLMRHQGSFLGIAWLILTPLLLLALYVFVFGVVFEGRFGVVPWERPVDHALGIMLGITLYHFLAETLAASPTIIVGQANLVRKVVFPLEVLPAAQVLASLTHFAVSFTLCFLGLIFLGPGLTAQVAWLPIILLPLLPLALGLAWSIAALGVFLRDLQAVMAFVATALMFASAVFYPVAKIPPGAWTFLRFNPLIHLIEQTRAVALWGLPPDLTSVGYTYIAAGCVATVGWLLFRNLRSAFADVL